MPEKTQKPPAPQAPGAAEIVAALKSAGIDAVITHASHGVHDTVYSVVIQKGS
jgi:tRNA G26 N,N-dimethylase Trm1